MDENASRIEKIVDEDRKNKIRHNRNSMIVSSHDYISRTDSGGARLSAIGTPITSSSSSQSSTSSSTF
eukprot:CAMPEP_0114370656 /NCGR_PEP_ID=MMETSP0101-20121206/32678_1 /TAXON_ID=38822 ORGANISM="Pteridomonas danica, Strain PT" /NCGR_SAMPLE_ID=MMETSP0101 /ASSEMBLY_ACC=CAM_ASM_000211 /LENGTH=67 /DNA_ID=CAMNT_0001522303 /DNA_START=49 /DNA_END=249 /DNA_ORIENTATION=-